MVITNIGSSAEFNQSQLQQMSFSFLLFFIEADNSHEYVSTYFL